VKMVEEKTSNLGQENQIKNVAEYILQKLADKLYNGKEDYYIITTNGEIYDLNEYFDRYNFDPLIDFEYSDPDAPPGYIHIVNLWFDSKSDNPVIYHYPFLWNRNLSEFVDVYLDTYLYKAPYAMYRYIAIISHFTNTQEIVIEVADIKTIAKNTNFDELLQKVFGKEIDEEDVDVDYEKEEEVKTMFKKQRLFDEYDFYQSYEILYKYYKENDKSLADKVEIIKNAYNYIFQPYRIVLPPNH